MTDIEKLKALALAKDLRFFGRFGTETEDQARVRRHKERTDAADLIESLVVDNERLRAELVTRCRVEGGNTSDKTDSSRSAPWYLTACKMGNAFYNLAQRDDLPPGWNETARGLVEEWDNDRKSIGSAPAAGTDKDAERYRLLTRGDIIQPDDEFLSDDCTSWLTDPSGIFAGLEYLPGALKAGRRKVAAIEAHTNKESTK